MEKDKLELAIRTQPAPFCYMCGSAGVLLHEGIKDCFQDTGQSWSIKICSDASCGLGWVEPMPMEEDIHKAYQAYYTHSDIGLNYSNRVVRLYKHIRAGYLAGKYGYYRDRVSLAQKLAGLAINFHPGRRAMIDAQIMEVPAGGSGSRLLEIGSGSGRTLELLRELGWTTQGVEQDPNAVRNCISKNLDVRQGTLFEQKYASDSFDAVIMSHVIEHLHDPRATLSEILRILKPGGLLSMTAPNILCLGARHFGKAWLGWDPPRHIHNFSPGSIMTLVKSAGFSMANVKTTINYANYNYMGSKDTLNGRKIRVMRWPVSERLAGMIYQMVMWAWLKFNKDIGDELIIMARKP